MKGRYLYALALLLLTAGAFAFRAPDRGNRPIHADESVHADKFNTLWKTGHYRYDPNEYHGPTLYYATLPVMAILGRHDYGSTQEADYRLVTVLFGAGLVLLLALLSDGLGRKATLVAGALTAISPALVFYSRYYIQETLFAFFTLAMLACGWRYAKSRKPGWLAAAGLSAGLMLATKETAVLSFAAAGGALALAALWTRRVEKQAIDVSLWWNRRHAMTAMAVGAVVACLLLSGCLTTMSGPMNLLRSYTPWLERAGSTDLHRHPWLYYLQMLVWTHRASGPVWSEGLIVALAVVGIAAALFARRTWLPEGSAGFLRFLAFYTLLLTLFYSVIPYKTPWCVLTFLDGMILLAGAGAVALVRFVPGAALKAAVCLLLLVGGGQLAAQAYRTSYELYTDKRNPYVYAQTAPDAENLEKTIDDIARYNPEHQALVVKVISADGYYWPLPWYLRRMKNVGYYTSIPADVSAPIVIDSAQFDEELTKKLDPTHLMTGYTGLRSGAIYQTWVRMDVWTKYIMSRPKPKEEPE